MSVGKDQHLAGLAANVVVERVLDAAQALFVNVHVAKDVRGQFPLGIKTPALPLEIDPAQIHARRCAPPFPAAACARSTQRNAKLARRVAMSSEGTSRTLPISRATMSGSAISDGTAKQESTGTLIASGCRLRSKISARLGADFHDQPLLVLRAE